MERRPLGPGGPRAGVLGICPGEGPHRDAIVRRARERGVTLFADDPVLARAAERVPYNLLDQKDANLRIAAAVRAGKGVVAVNVLAGGLLAGAGSGPRAALLAPLARDGRTLAQAAVQFVLANESVSAAMVRVSTPAHLDEILAAPDAPPLTGRDLELIFESWANRFD